MTQTIALTSDFQDTPTLEEQLKRFETLMFHLQDVEKVDAIIGNGDWADSHLGNDQKIQSIAMQQASQILTNKLGETKIKEYNTLLEQKYASQTELEQGLQNIDTLPVEDQEALNYIAQLQHIGQNITPQIINSTTYKEQAKIMEQLNIPVYGTIGNNDSINNTGNPQADILDIRKRLGNVVFLGEQENNNAQIGNTNVYGFNHTNYDQENIYGTAKIGVQPDDHSDLEQSNLYQRLKGKKPNLLVVHTPPNFHNHYENTLKETGEKVVGLETFIDEWDNNEPLVIHCGHSGGGNSPLKLYKNMNGKLVLSINTNCSSDGTWRYATAHFDESTGDFQSVEVYEMAA